MRKKFKRWMERTLEKARDKLSKAQSRYKRSLYRKMKSTKKDIFQGDFLYVDPIEGGGNQRLGGHAIGT